MEKIDEDIMMLMIMIIIQGDLYKIRDTNVAEEFKANKFPLEGYLV